MQFVNPWFFIGLLAIAIPILIHLFTFKRYKKVYFSSTELLKEIQTETKKQSKLKHLIILLLRILGIIFLVIAFAQPFLPVKNTFLDKDESLVSIYIDNSFSMQNTATNGTLLDEAKQKAKEIALAYKLSDKFQLLTNNLDGKHQRFVSREEFLQYLEEVELSPVSSKLSTVVKKQYDLLNSRNTTSKKSYIISDFQKTVTDFNNFPNDTIIKTFLVPVTSKTSDIANLYIDSLWFDSPIFREGSNVALNIRIHNTGSEKLDKVPVKLYINDKQQSLASADVEGKQYQDIKLTFKLEKTGILQSKVSLTDYPIVFDDDFYFSIQVQDHIPVLCINGVEDNQYLNHLFSLDSTFKYKTVAFKNIEYADIPNYNFIILNQLTDIPSGLTESLQKFVENGGSVLFFPSEQANIQSYQNALAQLKAPYLEKLDSTATKVSSLNYKSALYSGVFESMPNNMDFPSVFKHFKLKTLPSATKESIMQLQNGDDFLTVSYFSRGKVYVASVAPDSKHSNFVKHSLFVPTLYNMALYSQPLLQPYYFLESNDIIDIPFQKEAKDDVLKLVSYNGKFECIPGFKQTASRAILFTQGQISEAGNYFLTKAEKNLLGISFNYNRRESNMEMYAYSDMQKDVKDLNLANISVIKNTGKPMDLIIKQHTNIQLWKYFVLLALLMLLGEILVLRFWK